MSSYSVDLFSLFSFLSFFRELSSFHISPLSCKDSFPVLPFSRGAASSLSGKASHVANRLIKSYPDYKIVVLEKLAYCSSLKNLNPSRSSPNFKFINDDIESSDLVNYLLITESINRDTIMHFVAQTHVDNSFGNNFRFTKNIFDTYVLLEAYKFIDQIRMFIHDSTNEVYDET
ncbi:hypothetical protein L1887_09636 [Cichorium endivia]|nr:hypothetical protein L1887_09636 [Cichorium endivia]